MGLTRGFETARKRSSWVLDATNRSQNPRKPVWWTRPPKFRGREAPGSNPGPRPVFEFTVANVSGVIVTTPLCWCSRHVAHALENARIYGTAPSDVGFRRRESLLGRHRISGVSYLVSDVGSTEALRRGLSPGPSRRRPRDSEPLEDGSDGAIDNAAQPPSSRAQKRHRVPP